MAGQTKIILPPATTITAVYVINRIIKDSMLVRLVVKRDERETSTGVREALLDRRKEEHNSQPVQPFHPARHLAQLHE